MAVGLRRNPFGAQALFGYEDDFAPKPGPQFPGFGVVPGMDNTPDVEGVPGPTQLVEPIAPAEVGANEQEPSAQADYVTESQIEARHRLAKALMGNQQEVNHPLQAIGNAVNQIAGAWMDSKAEREAQANEKRRREVMQKAFSGDNVDFDAAMKQLAASGDPELVDKFLEYQISKAKRLSDGGDAPTTRNFYENDRVVTKQWNAAKRSWENVGDGAPRWKATSADDESGGAGGIAPTAQGATFALPDGRIVAAPFVKGRGYVYRDETGQYRDLPHDARPVTNSAGGPMTAPQYLKLKQDRQEGSNALSALDQYIKVVGNLPQGMNRWANDVSAKFKTFLGQSNLTPQEFNQLDAWQKQQALIGLFRTTVVGPGVVTEYDAVRIIQALGGDPSSALQNPQVLERVLNDLYQRKRAEVDILDREYQRNAPYFGEQPEPLGVPDQLELPGKPGSSGKPEPAAPKQYNDGETRVINGKKFVRKGGRWYPAQ